jgi:hypothetical protein
MAALAKHAEFVWRNFTSWLGIDSNRHLFWIVRTVLFFLYRSNMILEHVDGYNDGKAKYDMVIIDCLVLIKCLL